MRGWIGKSVLLHPISSGTDRWQRLVAHVELAARSTTSGPVPNGTASVTPRGQPAEVWLAAGRVDRDWCGQAWLPRARPPDARLRFIVTRTLRGGPAGGFGAIPGTRILSARDPELAERAGAYRIVAGIVVSVGATSRRHYLNFGRDWSRDFTVTIPADKADAFRAAGRDPDALVGRYIRVRGWLERWNGAVIDVRYPDAIEVIGRGG